MFKQIRGRLGDALRAAVGPGLLTNGHKLDRLTAQVDEMQREMRLLLGRAALPAPALWRNVQAGAPSAPGAAIFPTSTLCRQADFEQPYFAFWTAELYDVLRYHRKLWEFVYICQALYERGMLAQGKRGLGFGVGAERLTAAFAARGCRIVATDLAVESAIDTGWMETAQHAGGKDQLRYDLICPYEQFQANVQFRACDMNAVDADLTDFDFCWSACALEHLGSIEHGLAFIERSVDCLKPGGVAVHTTEFNLGLDDRTIDNAPTVLFRRRDLEVLIARLEAKGHSVAPLDLTPGQGEVDRYIDVPPYLADPHLTMALGGFPTTSIGLIVRRAA